MCTAPGKKCLVVRKNISRSIIAEVIRELCDKILADKLFGFLQVNIHVPDELLEKFSNFSPLFIINEVPEDQIPQHMKDYQEKTLKKTIQGTKKRLGVTSSNSILLYTPVLKRYIVHGLKLTAIYKYLRYESGKLFSWFPEEVSSARQHGDNNPVLKELGDTKKRKGNSLYGKMIKDLMKYQRTKFATTEDLVDKAFRFLSSKTLRKSMALLR